MLRLIIIFCFSWLVIDQGTGLCQTAVRISVFTPTDALAWKSLAGRVPISLSPDGQYLTYTTKDSLHQSEAADDGVFSKTGVPMEVSGSEVWVSDLIHNTPSRNLTPGWGTSWAPRWSPDGSKLAFYSDHSGRPHLFVWNRRSGRIQEFAGGDA